MMAVRLLWVILLVGSGDGMVYPMNQGTYTELQGIIRMINKA